MNILTFAKLVYIKFHKTEKDLFLFSSFNGHYSDSPKYISEAFYLSSPDIRIVWIVSPEKKKLLPSYVIPAIKGSYKETYYRARASVLIDNVYGNKVTELTSEKLLSKIIYKFKTWCIRKNNQQCYTTWHGTPLKRIGRDQVNNDIIDISANNIEMIHGNHFTLEIMEHLTFNKIPMALLGSPRNDILFSIDKQKSFELRNRLNIPQNKKVVLFAPSFRSDGWNSNVERSGLNQLIELDVAKLCTNLKMRFGEDWCLVCRFHYHVEKKVDWNYLALKYDQLILNGNDGDDMAEYLACTDVLITDVSCCMYDFPLTLKPCFIYFPDLDYYSSKERGLYEKIDNLPFPYSTTFDGLLANISSFDENKYIKDVTSLKVKYGYVDDGHSSTRIVRYILNK